MAKKRHLMEMKFVTEASEPTVLSVIVISKRYRWKQARSRWVEKRKLVAKTGMKPLARKSWGCLLRCKGVRHFWIYFERITVGVFVTRFQFLAFSLSVSRLYTHRRIMCLDEVPFVMGRSRRISRDTSSRRLLRTLNCLLTFSHVCEMWQLRLKPLSMVTPSKSIEFLTGKENS